jgi:hypothetical protein
MKSVFSLKSMLTLVLLATFTLSAFSQLNLPRKSPKASTSYTIGLTDITINYGSPAVNEREIWGALEPYDKVWRAGANEATTMEFSTDILIENQKLPAGKYSFFIIPKEGEDVKWTIIFNKVADQWGAYAYDESQDALRVDVKNKTGERTKSEDRLTYRIVDQSMKSGYIRFGWEKARLYIRFKVDYLDAAITNLETVVADTTQSDRHWSYYAQGADFLLGVNEKPEVALQWAKASTDLFSHGWNWFIRAEAEAANGDYKSAVQSVAKCKELDEASEKDNYYTESKAKIEAKLADWSSKS